MNDREFQALLERSHLLDGLDPLSRTALCMHFRPAHFGPGELLLQTGSAGDRMFLLLQGEARVRLPTEHGPVDLGLFGPDSFIGEVAFFGQDETRTADVVASSEIHAAQLTRETYDQMLRVDPGAAETLEKLVLDLMLERVAATNARMVELVAAQGDDGTFRAAARMLARDL